MKTFANLICAITFVLTFPLSTKAQWQKTNGPNVDYINCIAASNNNIYAASNKGLFLSRDTGEHWAASNNGLQDSNFISLIVGGANIFAGTPSNGVFVS